MLPPCCKGVGKGGKSTDCRLSQRQANGISAAVNLTSSPLWAAGQEGEKGRLTPARRLSAVRLWPLTAHTCGLVFDQAFNIVYTLRSGPPLAGAPVSSPCLEKIAVLFRFCLGSLVATATLICPKTKIAAPSWGPVFVTDYDVVPVLVPRQLFSLFFQIPWPSNRHRALVRAINLSCTPDHHDQAAGVESTSRRNISVVTILSSPLLPSFSNL